MADRIPAALENPLPDWHALDTLEIFHQLETRETGLYSAQATERLQRYGPNRLKPPRRRGPWLRLLAQFNNVLIYILLVAGTITAFLGHWIDSGVIFGVVVVNALIGFIQEGKAEKALEAVRNLLSQQASVYRDGRRQTLPAEELVPGDVVFLQSGDKVPADLRLFRIRNLRIDESVLTGESVAVEKQTQTMPVEAGLGDRRNMAFSGTLVTFGQGVGVVVATGDQSEIGRISAMLSEMQTLTTPLTRNLATFGRWLTVAILALAALTFGFGTLVRDYGVADMFLAAVGLAVAAIPEGLPAIITITLAIGVQRMAQRHAIIRRLPAVETLGSVSVICSDKTGTLTRNEMTVTTVATTKGRLEVSGVGYEPRGDFTSVNGEVTSATYPILYEICRAGLLCNDALVTYRDGHWQLDGDPTEGALVVLGLKAGLSSTILEEEFPRVDVIPFESQHRFMATLHHDHAGHGFIYLKGAPEVVLQRCNAQSFEGIPQALDLGFWHGEIESIAGQGQRTLAIAMKLANSDQRTLRFQDVDGDLVLLGVVGLIDPPREEAIRAVRSCQSAEIRVKMITGDHAATALAIARQMKIDGNEVAITGTELENLSDAELGQRATSTSVFARTSPEHKLRLVEALQANGAVVAMTGDGVNDAPALKRANVGVAMGIKGTEAAKEAAEMVLADDNFASIAHAVEEGRTVYDNIKKAILFILPTNGGEALTIMAAIALGRMLPVTPVQILWVNMITAVTLALAIAFEPEESNVMNRPPRDPREPLLSGFMSWRILFVSLLMVTGTFGLFILERGNGASIEIARTVAVNTLVVAEAFYLLNTRYLKDSTLNLRGLTGSRWVLGAIALVLFFQVLFTYLPAMQTLFGTAPIDGEAWLRIFGVGISLYLLVELEKLVMRSLSGTTAHKKRHAIQEDNIGRG